MSTPTLSDLMVSFRSTVERLGLTHEAVRDALNHEYLTHDPICVSTVHKWLHGTTPGGARLLAVIEFVQDHSVKDKSQAKKPSKKKTANR